MTENNILWERVISTEDLENKQSTVFKKAAKQIAVIKSEDKIFAIDNRCPHEGYPLIQGSVDKACVLTCNWHNWKFDLKTGKCYTGGDSVRTYQVKEEDSFIWVNISEPNKEEITSNILVGLKEAFIDRQYGRIARELARLYYNDIDPLIGLKKSIEWSFDKFEYGMTHAYAATADWVSLYLKNDTLENKLICLTEALDHISFDSLRYPAFPYTDKKLEWSHKDFIQAIETENEMDAIALLSGALDAGLDFKDLEKSLVEASLMHYNDFGHSLIYVYKTGYLINILGNEVTKPLLLSLVRSLCYTTRDDLLPDFKALPKYISEYNHIDNTDNNKLQISEIFGKPTNFVMAWVNENIKNNSPEKIYDSLLQVISKNLLHYNMAFQFAYDKGVKDNIGWLDFTHGLTFSNAVRTLCSRYPEYWKYGLLQIACFIGRNHQYLDLSINENEWIVNDLNSFIQNTEEKLLDHGIGAPIFSAHLLKTYMAAMEELEYASTDCQRYLLASVNRFLNSPIKAKNIRRAIKQSIDLVSRDFK